MEFTLRITATREEGMTLSNDTVKTAIIEEIESALGGSVSVQDDNGRESTYTVELGES